MKVTPQVIMISPIPSFSPRAIPLLVDSDEEVMTTKFEMSKMKGAVLLEGVIEQISSRQHCTCAPCNLRFYTPISILHHSYKYIW